MMNEWEQQHASHHVFVMEQQEPKTKTKQNCCQNQTVRYVSVCVQENQKEREINT